MEPRVLADRITPIKSSWHPRNQQIKKWYNMLLLEDELQQKNMESFVTNDPRTSFNLALYLLCPPYVPHRIPVDPLTLVDLPGTSETERGLVYCWKKVDHFNRKRGRKSFMRELVSYVLATGWYAVLAAVIPRHIRQRG